MDAMILAAGLGTRLRDAFKQRTDLIVRESR
jgi:dTDP-glucose pyrophosphorylase